VFFRGEKDVVMFAVVVSIGRGVAFVENMGAGYGV